MIQNIYPVIVTNQLDKVKTFWNTKLHFDVVFENEWYVQLQKDNIQIAYMSVGVKGQVSELQIPFSGEGITITIELDDIEAFYNEVKDNVDILLELKTEEWGQRHFMFKDPANTLVDAVEFTNPEDYK